MNLHVSFFEVLVEKRQKVNYILDSSRMQNADQYTIQELGILSAVLMEKAALKSVEIIEGYVKKEQSVLIICGSGNNGGDGFAIGRLLADKGYHPDIVFIGKKESRSEETKRQMAILERLQIPILEHMQEKEYDCIVDAIFGIGLSRDVKGAYKEVIDQINQMSGIKIAIDIPSGISADSGKVMGCAVKADHTVTFAYAKIGHILYPGANYTGKLTVADIGIYGDYDLDLDVCQIFDKQDASAWLPARTKDSNKGSYGKVLMITGSKGMSGAAYLSAKAAYAAGAGLVRIYTEEGNRCILQQLLPEAIVTTYEESDLETFSGLEQCMEWADVIGIGCGLGMSEKAMSLLEHLMQINHKPTVIDADGINLLARVEESKVKEWFAQNPNYILTPHMMEMCRFLKMDMKELKENRIQILKNACEAYRATFVLKDSRTLVGKKGSHFSINTTGNPAMAKGGSGDVLAGVICGLLGQKMDAYRAANLGVFLHGTAGDLARNRKSSYSVLASDLIDELANVYLELEANKYE